MIAAGVLSILAAISCLAQGAYYLSDQCTGQMVAPVEGSMTFTDTYMSSDSYLMYNNQGFCNLIGSSGLMAAVIIGVNATLIFIFTFDGSLDNALGAIKDEESHQYDDRRYAADDHHSISRFENSKIIYSSRQDVDEQEEELDEESSEGFESGMSRTRCSETLATSTNIGFKDFESRDQNEKKCTLSTPSAKKTPTHRPRKDSMLISIQVLSAVGLCLAWSSVYGGLVFALVGCILVLTPLCCQMKRCTMITSGVFFTLAAIACVAQGVLFLGDFCEGTMFRRRGRRLDDWGWGDDATSFSDMLDSNVDDDYVSDVLDSVMGDSYVSDVLEDQQEFCNLVGGFGLSAGCVMAISAILSFIYICGGRLDKYLEAEDKNEETHVASSTKCDGKDLKHLGGNEDRDDEEEICESYDEKGEFVICSSNIISSRRNTEGSDKLCESPTSNKGAGLKKKSGSRKKSTAKSSINDHDDILCRSPVSVDGKPKKKKLSSPTKLKSSGSPQQRIPKQLILE